MDDRNKSNNNKILIGFGIGFIAAGIAGYMLNSDEGRELQARTRKQIKKLEKDLAKSMKENKELLNEKVNAATKSAKSWSNEIAETVKNKISTATHAAEDAVEEVQDDFQQGMDKARRNMEAKAQLVNDTVNKSKS